MRSYFYYGTFPYSEGIPCHEIDFTAPQWQNQWNLKGEKTQGAEQGPFQGTDVDGIWINQILEIHEKSYINIKSINIKILEDNTFIVIYKSIQIY